MEAIHSFIDTNMTVLYFVYGQVFFTAGLAIALQQRSLSGFRLARHLWLLATFGIVHGLAEWGNVFIPIQRSYLSDSWINLFLNLQDLAFVVSFGFLLEFGVAVIAPWMRWGPHYQTVMRWGAVAWTAIIGVLGILILPGDIGESAVRYLLGFPAAAITAAALLAERHSFVAIPSQSAKARLNLTITAAAFGVYAVLSGLIVPGRTMWPLHWLTYQNVFSATGLPIQFYRAAIGFAMAFFIIRSLSVFDVEIKHRLEETEREQALLTDRQRIARDLHDGVVQAIYAAGLQLEVARSPLALTSGESASIIARVMDQLNCVITEIRQYIFNLGPPPVGHAELGFYLKRQVDDFSATCPIVARLAISGDRAVLRAELKQNIILIARECLGNVAKHSLASRVDVSLVYESDGIRFSVEDNGLGIGSHAANSASPDEGRGLGNIAERARSLGGYFSIAEGLGGRGTRVSVWAPFPVEETPAVKPNLAVD